MATFLKSFSGKRVLVTGHTGFKGSWLSEWLLGLDAEVFGFSLPPPTQPSLFNQLRLKKRVNHTEGDVRDGAAMMKAVGAAKPDFVFHLAAQPIVRAAHADPADTWSTNVMGTVNLLEALRLNRRECTAVIVTTDKVYGGISGIHSESDPIAARDPYGASKAAVELAVASWRASFFPIERLSAANFPRVALTTARAGNVIGGGDWARDRLLPDCARALSRGDPILVRNPSAVRPWQHVLDPLAGYLDLAAALEKARLSRRGARLRELSGPFNFGPAMRDHRTVREVVSEVLKHWPGTTRRAATDKGPVETGVLRLDAGKAHRLLGWRPRMGFSPAIAQTIAWYRGARSSKEALELTRRQIAAFMSL